MGTRNDKISSDYSNTSTKVVNNTRYHTFSLERVIEINGDSVTLDNISNIDPVKNSSGYYTITTTRASVKVFKGIWYYEVTITRAGTARIGWCTANYVANYNTAIGADENSWGFDGAHLRKYHKSITGEYYGEQWSTGDVIGTIVDFTSKRIYYRKNGKELGVAFNNVRAESGLYPVISVSGNAQLQINIGNDFKYPQCITGLNPRMSYEQMQSVENIFKKYSISTEGIPTDSILGTGLVRLGEDFGLKDPTTDPLLIIIAWKFNCKDQWTIHKNEWIVAWALHGVFTFNDMKNAIKTWKSDLSNDIIFKNFYSFTFEYLKTSAAATVLETTEAIMAWRLCGIHQMWPLYDKWEAFWKESSLKGVNKDTWNMLLTFIEIVNDNVDKYDVNDCWPTAYDEFVDKMKQNKW